MAFMKEFLIAAFLTAFVVAQLPQMEVPAVPELPVNQSMPAVPETPAGNNTQIPAVPENPAGNNTQIPAVPAMPDTNGTVPVEGVPAVPAVPGQEGSTTEAPSRFMNAINTISGLRGKRH